MHDVVMLGAWDTNEPWELVRVVGPVVRHGGWLIWLVRSNGVSFGFPWEGRWLGDEGLGERGLVGGGKKNSRPGLSTKW